jgi:hypothetical protein
MDILSYRDVGGGVGEEDFLFCVMEVDVIVSVFYEFEAVSGKCYVWLGEAGVCEAFVFGKVVANGRVMTCLLYINWDAINHALEGLTLKNQNKQQKTLDHT